MGAEGEIELETRGPVQFLDSALVYLHAFCTLRSHLHVKLSSNFSVTPLYERYTAENIRGG